MEELLASEKSIQEEIGNLQNLRRSISDLYTGINTGIKTGIKKCAYFPKCRYGSKCRYLHVSETHIDELKRIDEKLHELYEKTELIDNIKSRNRRICPDLCLEIKYSFKVNSCQDWGSGCGCKTDCLGDKVHEEPYYFENMVSYTWLDPKYFKSLSDGFNEEKFVNCVCKLEYDLERYRKFGSSFNFVGKGSDGKIKIHSVRTLPVKYNEKCIGMVDSETGTPAGAPTVITEAVIDLPDGYNQAVI